MQFAWEVAADRTPRKTFNLGVLLAQIKRNVNCGVRMLPMTLTKLTGQKWRKLREIGPRPFILRKYNRN